MRVLELASVLAGPQVGQFLAELGADVLKLEAPAGDVTRTWRTAAEPADAPVTAYFSSANWGKRSRILDLTEAAGRQQLHELAATTDIVLTSYKPGDAEKLGADYATLAARNPRLIYGAITGYGPASPRAGYDAVLQAETGFMHLNAPGPGQLPQKMPVALLDVLTAHQLKEAVLLALYQRERTGRGARLEVSLHDSALASLANQAATVLVTGQDPQPLGSGHPSIVPYGTVYRAADGTQLLLAVGSDGQFRQLCTVLGRPAWAADARFRTNPARVAHRKALEELLAARLAEVPGEPLLAELAARAVPAGAVRTVQQALSLPAAQPMLLPPTASFPHPGLRTVAFRSSAWPVAAALLPPPAPGCPAADEPGPDAP
ncbi:CoA transferase [Hymenobacter sp. NST-14]|nr:CoA transferase [Hymenobacter piscis]